MAFTIRHPQSEAEFRERDALLQITMREPRDDLAIASDYPLVLSHQFPERSFCLFEQNKLIAHINLLKRTLFTEQTQHAIGFIGNVATHPNYQGKGYGQQLMHAVETFANQNQLQALILWNDIPEFYTKLGFKPFGQELRFIFDTKKIQRVENNFEKISLDTFYDFKKLEALRLENGAKIERSNDDWRMLLTIPRTHLFVERNLESYFIFGRGSDMQFVIHEWGTKDPAKLLGMLSKASEMNPFVDLMLLAPVFLPRNFQMVLEKSAREQVTESVCWVKWLGKIQDGLEKKIFIWGLDSI